VDIVKLDADMLSTVPAAPPEAGADRALDPSPPDPALPVGSLPNPGCPTDDEGDVPVADGAALHAVESPSTADIRAADTIHRPFRVHNGRRRFCRGSRPAMDSEADDAAGWRFFIKALL
jgi:hypothetical protein